MTLISSSSEAPTLANPELRSTSRRLKLAFTVLTIVMSGLLLSGLAAMVLYVLLRLSPAGQSWTCNQACLASFKSPIAPAFLALPLWKQVAVVVPGFLTWAPILAAFWSLRSLFDQYSSGGFFTKQSCLIIRRFGLLIILAEVIAMAGRGFLHLIDASVLPTNLGGAIVLMAVGALICLMAQVMHVGREIEDDRSQFV